MLLALGLVVILVTGWPEVPVDEPHPSAAPAAPRPEGGASGTLRILTWNVLAPAFWEAWVEALGWGETPGVRRARELLAASQRLGADLVAFQEVTGPFLRLVSTDPHWRTYHATFQATPGAAAEPPGGLLILSRYPITHAHYQKLPSPTGRALLSARITIDGQDLTLATLHLESLPEEATARVRQIQALAGNRRLDSRYRTLIVGDFNHGDGDKEQRLPHLAEWRDAWLTSRPDPDDAGLTYDVERNPLARANAFAAEPSRRLDRILLSSDLTPLAVGLVTPGPAQGAGRPPSDHYGVWIDITWPPSAAPEPIAARLGVRCPMATEAHPGRSRLHETGLTASHRKAWAIL
jgi:endonuclease/exonuclease/phosphatase family metal-dependent hydrolase